jgi:hypothetical protein
MSVTELICHQFGLDPKLVKLKLKPFGLQLGSLMSLQSRPSGSN